MVSSTYTPHPWEVSYEFVRQICRGFVVTIGPRSLCEPKQAPIGADDTLRVQIVLIKDGQATKPLTRELPATSELQDLAERIADAISLASYFTG